MAAADTRVAPVAVETTYNLQWTNIIAGAICASALAFVLHAFAGAIGISPVVHGANVARFFGCIGASCWALPCFGGLSLIWLWRLRGRTSSPGITNHRARNC